MPNQRDRLLVAYSSRLGSTGEVASFIGRVLSEDGTSVDVKGFDQVGDLGPYNRFVLGSAIRYSTLR